MGVYKVRVAGRRKPIYLKAANKTEAIAAVADAVLLTNDEVVDAMEGGVALWKPGTELPEDDKPEAAEEAPAESEGVAGSKGAENE